MSLWHGMLRASSWARCVVGQREGSMENRPFSRILAHLSPSREPELFANGVDHTIALSAECLSAKHPYWMLILLLLLSQWTVVTSQFCSPIPCQDPITSTPKVGTSSQKA